MEARFVSGSINLEEWSFCVKGASERAVSRAVKEALKNTLEDTPPLLILALGPKKSLRVEVDLPLGEIMDGWPKFSADLSGIIEHELTFSEDSFGNVDVRQVAEAREIAQRLRRTAERIELRAASLAHWFSEEEAVELWRSRKTGHGILALRYETTVDRIRRILDEIRSDVQARWTARRERRQWRMQSDPLLLAKSDLAISHIDIRNEDELAVWVGGDVTRSVAANEFRISCGLSPIPFHLLEAPKSNGGSGSVKPNWNEGYTSDLPGLVEILKGKRILLKDDGTPKPEIVAAMRRIADK